MELYFLCRHAYGYILDIFSLNVLAMLLISRLPLGLTERTTDLLHFKARLINEIKVFPILVAQYVNA
jgi:hypothetical protein